MMKQILAASVVLFSISGFSASLVCRTQVDPKTERIILINDSVAMVCQAAIGTDFNDQSLRSKICAASSGVIVAGGFMKTGSAGQKVMTSLQTVHSVFNDFTNGLVLSTSFTTPQNSSATFAATLEITAAAGIISGNSVVISKPLNISLNKKETLQNCSLK